MSTAVLRPIILLYSSMETMSLLSKSMSYCWPSQTSTVVLKNRFMTLSCTSWGALAMRLYASMSITSPERMAVLSFHLVHTVGTPLRSGERSMMSSCISWNEWNTSRAAAGESISSPNLSPKKEYVVRQSLGRRRLPPISIM